MLQNADNKLFSLMFRSSHYLHTLLSDLKVTDIVLRNSETSFNLPHCSYKLYKQSFVNRCLFCDCYWYVLFCGTYMLFDPIWCIIFSLHIIGWRLSVSINDMLCYVMLFPSTGSRLQKEKWIPRQITAVHVAITGIITAPMCQYINYWNHVSLRECET